MSRTITHLYDSYEDATRAVRMLEDAGIPNSDISLVGHDQSEAVDRADAASDTASGSGAGAGATAGTVIGGGLGLVAGIGALAIPGVGPVVAAGWLVSLITGAGIGAGAGGLLGSLVGSGHSEQEANVYAEGVRRGGTLVSVRTDDAQAAQVEMLLNGTGRVDIAQRGADYRAGGWERFDETRPVEPRPVPPPAGAGVGGAGMAGGVPGPSPEEPITTPEAAERDRLRSSTHG